MTALTWWVWEGVIGAGGGVWPRPLLIRGRETKGISRHPPQSSACEFCTVSLIHGTEPIALPMCVCIEGTVRVGGGAGGMDSLERSGGGGVSAYRLRVFHFEAVAGDWRAVVVRGGPVEGEEVDSSSGEGGRVGSGGWACSCMEL